MITQSNHNALIERVKILTRLHELDRAPDLINDIVVFLHRLKSFDEYESMSMPTSVYAQNIQNTIVFEWDKITETDELSLTISFPGEHKIRVQAVYSSLEIKVDNTFPINEDMANFVTTHLENFKKPLKKKRYK